MRVRAILASLLTALLLLSGSAASACDLRCNLAHHTATPASRVDATLPACHEATGSMAAMQTAGHSPEPRVAAHAASPRMCGHMICASPALLTQPSMSATASAGVLAACTWPTELLPVRAALPSSAAHKQETPPPLLSPLALHTTLRL